MFWEFFQKHSIFSSQLSWDIERLPIVSNKENISLTFGEMVITHDRSEVREIYMLWGRLLNIFLYNNKSYSRNSLTSSIHVTHGNVKPSVCIMSSG